MSINQIPKKKRIPFNKNFTYKKQFEFIYEWGLSPHPQKIAKGGQDALYAGSNILVIADGVGGWKQCGIDAGLYSRNLVNIIIELVQTNNKNLYYIQRPYNLAIQAVKRNKELGSSTLTIITLHPQNGSIRCYQIGDSIYGFFQNTKQPILSEQQQISFNLPKQVGYRYNEKNIFEQYSNLGDVYYGNFKYYSYQQIIGKNIIVATDGLWDNLSINSIQNIIQENNYMKNNVEKLINMVFNLYMQKNNYESPFYIKAKKMGIECQKKAKIDDISLIIALVYHRQAERIKTLE